MILLREIQTRDINALEASAQIPGFINLSDDRDVLNEKIQASVDAFVGKTKNKSEAKYWFVAEDIERERVVGTSMIAGQHGTKESPHFYLQIGTEQKFSATMNTGFLHGTLELKWDADGPSEIGGLVVDPEVRNTPERIGRQISFVRFLYLGLNRNRFKSKIIAELLPPLNKKGQSPLWEAIGRRFTNMDYWEADKLCQKNKEFILSLFPSGKIYTTFFSAEARNAIGKVGKDTEPVFHMLKRIGFNYVNQVDPFDGGPHLWADVENLAPIRGIKKLSFNPKISEDGVTSDGLVCKEVQKAGEFRAIATQVRIQGKELKILDPQKEKLASKLLGIGAGDALVFMPYYGDSNGEEQK